MKLTRLNAERFGKSIYHVEFGERMEMTGTLAEIDAAAMRLLRAVARASADETAEGLIR